MSDIKIIHGNNYENKDGNQYNFKGNAVQINLSQQAPVSELLALLEKVKQDLSVLSVPEAVKQDVEYGIQGALMEANKPSPDRKRIAARISDAISFLKENAKTVKDAVALVNILGQGIAWCGEQWTNWAG